MDTYQAAQSALPAWTGWIAALTVCALASGLAHLGSYVGSKIALRPLRALDRGAPWEERARIAYPARIFSAVAALLPAAIAAGFARAFAGPLSIVSWHALIVLAVVSSVIPGFRRRLLMEREIRRITLPVGRWIRGGVVLTVLMMPHLIIASASNVAMPDELGARALITLAIATGITFYLVRGGTLDVLRALRLARPASPRLEAIVERTARQAEIRPAAVFELDGPWANAYAYPLSKRLAFTDEALETMTDDEVAAVCAHELGHLTEPRSIAATRLLTVFALFLPLAIARPLLVGRGPKAVLVAVLIAYVLMFTTRVVFLRLFRRLEERADKVAHKHEGDPGTYARALTRLHEVNLMPVVMRKGRVVHPSLYDRVAAAGAPMERARPEPPPQAPGLVATVVMLFLVVGGYVGALTAIDVAARPLDRGMSTSALFAAAARGGSDRDLDALDRILYGDSDADGPLPDSAPSAPREDSSAIQSEPR